MKILFTFIVLSLMTAFVMAAPDIQRKADFSVLTRADTAYRFRTLNFTSADGLRHYRVYVGVPEKTVPPQGFPVFYSLDGNAMLGELTTARLQQLARQPDTPVIVLLGYATDLRLDVDSRAFDYTPANPHITARRGRWQLGGAQGFLEMLAQQIQPAVARVVPVNPRAQTLFGHSYGGLFVLYALFNRPQLFQHYVAADPAIWEQQGIILDDAQRFMHHHDALHPTTLRILKSGRSDVSRRSEHADEQTRQMLAVRQQYISRIGVNAAEKLSAELAENIPDLSICYEVYPHDTHGSLFPRSFRAALTGLSD